MALPDTITNLGTAIISLIDRKLTNKEDKNKAIISLSGSGTLSLTNNTVHKVTATGNITFSLPTGSTAIFGQMLVELYMASIYTITLGTSYYFHGETPDMSAAGYYTLIYEYDSVRDGWVVGVLKKASV